MSLKRILVLFMVTVGTFSFAQEAKNVSSTPVGNEPLLQEIANLKDLAKKVNDAQSEVAASATGSRAQGATAQQHLKAACDEYIAALNAQLLTANGNAALTEALNREIAATKNLVPAENKSR